MIGDAQMLVRIHAASVDPVDWRRLTGTPRVLRAQDERSARLAQAEGRADRFRLRRHD
ncbi:MAG TPA: hypothetical protein VF062_20375 [Candidatus Limnocylindrales bacterium]